MKMILCKVTELLRLNVSLAIAEYSISYDNTIKITLL